MLEHLDKTGGKRETVKAPPNPSRRGSGYRTLGENAGDRDNQQERLRKLTWLAVALECEGTFTFQYNEQEKRGRIHSHIQPRVIFVNTDLLLVERAEKVAIELGFKPYRRDGIIGGIGKKPKAELQWNGFKAIPLLRLVRPLMVGQKAEAADCLIRFVECRQTLLRPKQPYGEFEFGLLARVRQINSGHWLRKPKFSSLSSTTVRQRREKLRAKIQSGLRGDTQSVAETTTPPIQ